MAEQTLEWVCRRWHYSGKERLAHSLAPTPWRRTTDSDSTCAEEVVCPMHSSYGCLASGDFHAAGISHCLVGDCLNQSVGLVGSCQEQSKAHRCMENIVDLLNLVEIARRVSDQVPGYSTEEESAGLDNSKPMARDHVEVRRTALAESLGMVNRSQQKPKNVSSRRRDQRKACGHCEKERDSLRSDSRAKNWAVHPRLGVWHCLQTQAQARHILRYPPSRHHHS